MVKVSVVIPVYNVENYLEDCLDSIVNQTLTDIEIICINDGSTDKSQQILEKYQEKDDRITLINQENGGHALATNRGMALATGEYLFLMDSDDIIDHKALELTYNRAQETYVDFVIFKAINYNHAEDEYYETESYSMDEIYKKVGDNVFSYEDVREHIFSMSVTPWSKLYNRSFIEKYHIEFPEGLIFDDNIFFWEVLFNAEKIVFLNEFLFTRRFYSTSSTNNGDLRFLDSLEINDLKWEVFQKHDHFTEHKKILYDSKIRSAYNRYTSIQEQYSETFYQAMRKSFMKILESEKLFNDFMENAEEDNRNIFIQVVSCDNSESFNLLRDTYSAILKT
ncbi:MAG: glycosyltransferase family 2 protein [Methanosphaera sp.]|nr:glycosyltransferase family 2 protein [Methanosphaera sp.]